ncbi:ecotin family protein [Rickettsia canadensis]|uniref:ecotin family protein n=1 Tax=Rickettsia canadensis TaxID=788 RepID=UPI0022AABFCB|nr:ecotin family protein [Rickettsia canadensis]
MRYNSKRPIVVYAPKDIELHYVIWNRDKTINSTIVLYTILQKNLISYIALLTKYRYRHELSN